MLQRYPFIPDLVICLVGVYFAMMAVFQVAGINTVPATLARLAQQNAESRARPVKETSSPARTTAPEVEPEKSVDPALLETPAHIVPRILLLQPTTTAAEIPVLMVAKNPAGLTYFYGGARFEAWRPLLDQIVADGVAEVLINVPEDAMQEQALTDLAIQARAQGVRFRLPDGGRE